MVMQFLGKEESVSSILTVGTIRDNMPIYEYECKACGHKFERLQSLGEVFDNNCPNCTKNSVKKVMSVSNFRLYGDGFHKPNKK